MTSTDTTPSDCSQSQSFLRKLTTPKILGILARPGDKTRVASDKAAAKAAYKSFCVEYPEYALTSSLDTLRRREFTRLERSGDIYVDYMGGCLYPESLIKSHTKFLNQHVLGNTHSISSSSMLSLKHACEAREAVLSHFRAPQSEYTVVFTANASSALKLVGESYPFSKDSCLLIGADSHNSVHGLREFANARGASTIYIPSCANGGFDLDVAKELMTKNRPCDTAPRLFAMTGQSNISNTKLPLDLCKHASSLGYDILLDAAALAPTSRIDLSVSTIDAMAVSFYKMFGYPTGVGALVVKKSFLKKLQRPWFAGGTVNVVQVPGMLFTRTSEIHEQFEDGTINYLHLVAITTGLQFLSEYLPILPLRLSCLLSYLASSLAAVRHDTNGQPVVQILSKLPDRRPSAVGEQCDTGSILSCLFLDSSGNYLPNSFIEYAATSNRISLRTGCMCNPGGLVALLGVEKEMEQFSAGATVSELQSHLGRDLGIVRISFGLASNFQDAWKVVRFASLIAKEPSRQRLWDEWSRSRRTTCA